MEKKLMEIRIDLEVLLVLVEGMKQENKIREFHSYSPAYTEIDFINAAEKIASLKNKLKECN